MRCLFNSPSVPTYAGFEDGDAMICDESATDALARGADPNRAKGSFFSSKCHYSMKLHVFMEVKTTGFAYPNHHAMLCSQRIPYNPNRECVWLVQYGA